MRFYEKGPVRIHFEEVGSGFPLLLIPGGGLNSTIAWNAKGAPFNPVEEFKNEYRCITADLRNAHDGQSTKEHISDGETVEGPSKEPCLRINLGQKIGP